MKLSSKIIIAILTIAGSSGVVYAVSRHSDWHMTPREKVEFVTDRVSKKLELDEQQRQNFNSLAETVAQIMLEARAARERQVDEIVALLDDPSLNQARALDIVQQKTQLVNDRAPQVIASLALFVDSLNDAQKSRLREMIEHRREHRHFGHGHGHDDHPGNGG